MNWIILKPTRMSIMLTSHVMVSQIINISTVYCAACLGWWQWNHQIAKVLALFKGMWDQWIPLTKGQSCRTRFHVMTSSYYDVVLISLFIDHQKHHYRGCDSSVRTVGPLYPAITSTVISSYIDIIIVSEHPSHIKEVAIVITTDYWSNW